jgi:hypothetical protein
MTTVKNKQHSAKGIDWKAEVGLRPVGAIGAYAPEGMRKVEKNEG